ncbi:helix-turn-helix domain-containing protein [Acholeplasma sp. OttesenSCG-928-E16]|nr:helix-turn-helix domain-containing protein [Acholeplasma sp. OttesenSCG-928-E16]
MLRLKELRKEKGLKQKDLAALIGVKQSAMSDYENEKLLLDQHKIKKLVDALNTSADYLLGFTDKKPENNN